MRGVVDVVVEALAMARACTFEHLDDVLDMERGSGSVALGACLNGLLDWAVVPGSLYFLASWGAKLPTRRRR